ncbi:TolC family protein [Phocaeicola massiliensis]|uniref:TolC family protein n=1 Tax=Phocaeicola massiliensis TaxID=204516 RepID=UPI00202FEA45|nr:TolC family protein [Phocaeicola massiliensis]MCM1613997.1 TolC family protein [Phocaeicola massiliensis]MCM1705983.1 TolC family protein [Phocaeicola massiliensis]
MWKKYILFSFSLCVSSVAVAQQNTLLEKYRSMAVEYSHDLKAADKNIAASIELEKAAQKDLYPKLSGNANFQYTGNPLELTLDLPSTGNPVTFEGKDLKYSASVSLTQPIYTGGRLLETIRLARYRHNVSGFQEEYIRSGIYLQTDMQYWNTVARTEIVRISDDYRNSIASLTQTIRERVNAGLTDRQDLLMMEVKLNEAEYQLLQARKNLENGLMALNSLIGVELGAPTEVEDSVSMVVVNDVSLWSDGGAVRPELKIATEQIRMAESEKKLVLSKYRPQFYVGVDGSYSSPGYNFRTDMDPNYAVYAKVSVPLFEWGKRKNEKRASSFKVDMATDNLNKVTDGVNLEIRTARNSLRQAMEQAELTRNSLDKARENETMALERYDEGKSSITEVIDAQTYRQIAQMNHVQAKVSAQNYYSELLKALNKY